MPEPPRPSLLLHVVSILLIVVCLSFAGVVGTWLMSREWQEKTIAVGLMLLPLLLAIFQYRGTYRFHVRSITYAEVIVAMLCALSAVPLVMSVDSMVRMLAMLGVRVDGTIGPILFGALLATVFLATAWWQNGTWRAKLEWAAEEGRLPAMQMKISLKETFLLGLAVALMAGISSYFVRHGYPY